MKQRHDVILKYVLVAQHSISLFIEQLQFKLTKHFHLLVLQF